MLEYIPLFSLGVDGLKSLYNRVKEDGYEKKIKDYKDYELSPREREKLKRKTRILIPCYNSEKTLEKIIPKYGDWIENITIIDDGSKDKTASKARDLGIEDIISLKNNSGKLEALNRGIKSLDNSIDYIALFDGDTFFKGDLERALLFLDGGDKGKLKKYEAAALHVLPDIGKEGINLTIAYQYYEYMLAMGQKKGMYGNKNQVMNISGCAGLYNRPLLSEILDLQLENGRGVFEGEDYWRTQKILSRGYEVPLIPKDIGIGAITQVPNNFKELALQRIKYWCPGRVKVNWEFGKDILKGDRRAFELAYDSVFNVLMEPAKLATLPFLATSPALPAFFGFYIGLTYYNYNRYFKKEDKDKLRKYLLVVPFYQLAMLGVNTIGYLNGVKKKLFDWRHKKRA